MKLEHTNTKPAHCKRHGVQPFVMTSPLFSRIIENNGPTNAYDFCEFRIESLGEVFEYIVDGDFLQKFMGGSMRQVITLKDRDKTAKEMNDRLIIQRIVREMEWVCSKCFQKIILDGKQE